VCCVCRGRRDHDGYNCCIYFQTHPEHTVQTPNLRGIAGAHAHRKHNYSIKTPATPLGTTPEHTHTHTINAAQHDAGPCTQRQRAHGARNRCWAAQSPPSRPPPHAHTTPQVARSAPAHPARLAGGRSCLAASSQAQHPSSTAHLPVAHLPGPRAGLAARPLSSGRRPAWALAAAAADGVPPLAAQLKEDMKVAMRAKVGGAALQAGHAAWAPPCGRRHLSLRPPPRPAPPQAPPAPRRTS
jgi:hypothetical protein